MAKPTIMTDDIWKAPQMFCVQCRGPLTPCEGPLNISWARESSENKNVYFCEKPDCANYGLYQIGISDAPSKEE